MKSYLTKEKAHFIGAFCWIVITVEFLTNKGSSIFESYNLSRQASFWIILIFDIIFFGYLAMYYYLKRKQK